MLQLIWLGLGLWKQKVEKMHLLRWLPTAIKNNEQECTTNHRSISYLVVAQVHALNNSSLSSSLLPQVNIERQHPSSFYILWKFSHGNVFTMKIQDLTQDFSQTSWPVGGSEL